MVDNVAITAGTGTTIAADDLGAGVLAQRVKPGWGPDGTGNDIDTATGKPLPVQVRSATGLIPLGEPTDDKNPATNTTSVSLVSLAKQISASAQLISTALGATALDLGLSTGAQAMSSGYQAVGLANDSPGLGAEDQASADAHSGMRMLAVRKATPTNTSSTDGDYEFPQMSGGYLWTHDNKGLAVKAFTATFTTLTRPANSTPYTAADSISDNATAGSVTALSATVSDVADDPIVISEILVSSTDTGLAGKKLRAYLFNSNPTSSSGVSGGDNAAYAQKVAGYVGSFMGYMETGFSDGTVGRLVPSYNETNYSQAGGFVVTTPTSGAQTLFIQFQAVEAFTPSANSTTIIAKARGWQARAA